jgi:hypothetical protein
MKFINTARPQYHHPPSSPRKYHYIQVLELAGPSSMAQVRSKVVCVQQLSRERSTPSLTIRTVVQYCMQCRGLWTTYPLLQIQFRAKPTEIGVTRREQ